MEELIKEMENLGYRMCNNCIPKYTFEMEDTHEFDEVVIRFYIFPNGFYKEITKKKDGDLKGDVATSIEETETVLKIMKLLRGDK